MGQGQGDEAGAGGWASCAASSRMKLDASSTRGKRLSVVRRTSRVAAPSSTSSSTTWPTSTPGHTHTPPSKMSTHGAASTYTSHTHIYELGVGVGGEHLHGIDVIDGIGPCAPPRRSRAARPKGGRCRAAGASARARPRPAGASRAAPGPRRWPRPEAAGTSGSAAGAKPAVRPRSSRRRTRRAAPPRPARAPAAAARRRHACLVRARVGVTLSGQGQGPS